MKRTRCMILLVFVTVQILLGGCRQEKTDEKGDHMQEKNQVITFGTEVAALEDGLSAVQHIGDYGFEEFLSQGGAATDDAVVEYLTKNLFSDLPNMMFEGAAFGCSTLSVRNKESGYLFGRNFDWNQCDAMIVSSNSENGYASISTVNMDFIQTGGISPLALPASELAKIVLYAPLDGMNEKGFAIAANMIQDTDTIDQDTEKPDLTTTTAIRLLLNQAATVEEALNLLKQYDMHASMGMMVHFALADNSGHSVVVEYVENKMVVTETPIVTNFYFSEGKKYGIGSSQSHMRYDILDQRLKKSGTMSMGEVKEAMDCVSKDNFDEFESTEWSIVMNQSTGEMTWYHRENYDSGYTFLVK